MWPKNTVGEINDLALPLDPGSRWDGARWAPDALTAETLRSALTADLGWKPAAAEKSEKNHVPY